MPTKKSKGISRKRKSEEQELRILEQPLREVSSNPSFARSSTATGENPAQKSITQTSIDSEFQMELHHPAPMSTTGGEIPLVASVEGRLQGSGQAARPSSKLLSSEYNLRSRASNEQQESSVHEEPLPALRIENSSTTSIASSSRLAHYSPPARESDNESDDEEGEEKGWIMEFMSKFDLDEFVQLPIRSFGPHDELVSVEETNKEIFDEIIQAADKLVLRQGRELCELIMVHRCKKEIDLTTKNVRSIHHEKTCDFVEDYDGETRAQIDKSSGFIMGQRRAQPPNFIRRQYFG